MTSVHGGSAADTPEDPAKGLDERVHTVPGRRRTDEDEGDREIPDGQSRPTASSGPVTREHVRQLLATHDGSGTLLLEGRAKVIATAERNTDGYAGALDVMPGDELAHRISPDSPSDHEPDMLSGTLNTMVAQLGS